MQNEPIKNETKNDFSKERNLGQMSDEIWKIRVRSLMFLEFHRKWLENSSEYIKSKLKSKFLPLGYVEKDQPQFFDQKKENINTNIRAEVKWLR